MVLAYAAAYDAAIERSSRDRRAFDSKAASEACWMAPRRGVKRMAEVVKRRGGA
jgi:hypothetical protein